jgi:hypothetical protein
MYAVPAFEDVRFGNSDGGQPCKCTAPFWLISVLPARSVTGLSDGPPESAREEGPIRPAETAPPESLAPLVPFSCFSGTAGINV